MKHLRQTIIDTKNGNCWATCIACILGMELDDVPNFCAEGSDTTDGDFTFDWYYRTAEWLFGKGYGLVTFDFPTQTASLIVPSSAAIVTGPSPRFPGFLHSVVGHVEQEYVETNSGFGHTFSVFLDHDPHPSDLFFDGKSPVEVALLVKLL